MRTCESCGESVAGDYELMSYCIHCGKNLCDDCMDKGYCESAPSDRKPKLSNRHKSSDEE